MKTVWLLVIMFNQDPGAAAVTIPHQFPDKDQCLASFAQAYGTNRLTSFRVFGKDPAIGWCMPIEIKKD